MEISEKDIIKSVQKSIQLSQSLRDLGVEELKDLVKLIRVEEVRAYRNEVNLRLFIIEQKYKVTYTIASSDGHEESRMVKVSKDVYDDVISKMTSRNLFEQFDAISVLNDAIDYAETKNEEMDRSSLIGTIN